MALLLVFSFLIFALPIAWIIGALVSVFQSRENRIRKEKQNEFVHDEIVLKEELGIVIEENFPKK